MYPAHTTTCYVPPEHNRIASRIISATAEPIAAAPSGNRQERALLTRPPPSPPHPTPPARPRPLAPSGNRRERALLTRPPPSPPRTQRHSSHSTDTAAAAAVPSGIHPTRRPYPSTVEKEGSASRLPYRTRASLFGPLAMNVYHYGNQFDPPNFSPLHLSL